MNEKLLLINVSHSILLPEFLSFSNTSSSVHIICGPWSRVNGGTSTWQYELCVYVTAWLVFFFLNHRIIAGKGSYYGVKCSLSRCPFLDYTAAACTARTDWTLMCVCVCVHVKTHSDHTVRLKTGGAALRDCSCPVLFPLWLHFSFSSFKHWPDTPGQSACQATGNSPRAPDSQYEPECVSPSIIYFYYFYYFFALTACLFLISFL